MSDTKYLDWPFFEPRHVQMQRELDAWAHEHISQHAHADVDAECRALVAALGDHFDFRIAYAMPPAIMLGVSLWLFKRRSG